MCGGCGQRVRINWFGSFGKERCIVAGGGRKWHASCLVCGHCRRSLADEVVAMPFSGTLGTSIVWVQPERQCLVVCFHFGGTAKVTMADCYSGINTCSTKCTEEDSMQEMSQ